ncbi:MAG: hypothetical protein HY050_04560 [Actinobacteria bacterium]|nr:hypothetical protein [Actinomycetota bacterium]
MRAFRIRMAEDFDLEEILNLANGKRLEYETYQPVFWRVAPDAKAQQRTYIADQIADEKVITLVATSESKLVGFVIGRLVPAPPVYNPGGLTCSIDDFVVRRNDLWETIGADLLDQVRKVAISKGAVQVVVVCGHFDEPKRKALEKSSLTIASEWWVAPLDTQSR